MGEKMVGIHDKMARDVGFGLICCGNFFPNEFGPERQKDLAFEIARRFKEEASWSGFVRAYKKAAENRINDRYVYQLKNEFEPSDKTPTYLCPSEPPAAY